MKSIEKTAKDFLFMGCVFFSLWIYLQGVMKEFSLWNPQEGIKPMQISIREEPVSAETGNVPEQKEPKAEIIRKEVVTLRNKEAERILALIQEGKLSSHRASFYRKLPSVKDHPKEQERTK